MTIPEDPADVSVLARETGEQMAARLELFTLQPERILYLGDRQDGCVDLLKKRYPSAEVIETEELLIADQAIDLLFSNLSLPWCVELEKTLREWQRILRPEGLLMLTAFGPDTLQEIEERNVILPKWMDMHNLGDALAAAGFADPVVDVEYFTLTYREHKSLLRDLQETRMISEDATVRFVPDVTYEVIYGHAFGTELTINYTADETGTVKIPLTDLRRRLS